MTVTEAPNMAPRYKAGKALGNLRMELDLDGHTDNQAIDLSEYFEDPDGILLFFKVVTNDEEVINVHSVAAMNADAASGSLDGTDDDDTMLIVEPLKAGTATVTVTVLDNDQASEDFSFMVTVTAEDTNEEPGVTSGLSFPGTDPNFAAFVGLDGASRFKSTDTMSKTLKLDLGLLFDDPDNEANSRTSGDSWTFDAVSTDMDVVTVMLESTGNGEVPDEHNVVITPVGSGEAMIYFTVTDSFGKSAGGMDTEAVFSVKVNTAPVPYSGEGDDRKSLSTEMEHRNLVAQFSQTDSATLVDDPNSTDVAEGYFSDKDGDLLLCRLVSQTGDSATINITGRNAFTLTGAEGKTGTSTFTIRCFDQAGTDDFESADDTLTVTVPYLQSIQ